MDYPTDFKILVDWLLQVKNKMAKVLGKIKDYFYGCLERGFNSINEHDRTEM